MTKPSPTPAANTSSDIYSLDGIEVVELREIDLDFAVEEAFREGASQALETTRLEPATPDELRALDPFRELDSQNLTAVAAKCQSIHAVPGYVLLAPGRLNTKIYFVVEGQLRLYARTGDKRPIAVADVGQSTGLRSALAGRPANHAVIATEVSHVLAVDLATFDDLAKRSHAFARNYNALLTSYLRGDNCLAVGKRGPGGAARQGYVDELTLLHNQYWIDTVFPRLVGRFRMGDKKLAVVAFGIDKIEDIIRQHGIGAGMRILEAVGPWVLDQTRPTDLLAINKNRHVFVLMPDCDLDAARQLAGRLKAAIQNLPIALQSNSTAAPITVTLALGIAELAAGTNDTDFLARVETLIDKSAKLGGNWLSETLDNP